MDDKVKSPHGHTWKVEITSTDDLAEQAGIIQDELTYSFLFNVQDRMLLDIFKNNGFDVIEFNEQPDEKAVAKWIMGRLRLSEKTAKQIVVHNIIYIPDDEA